MFLNASEIQNLIFQNPDFISPFDINLIKAASYTFRLGEESEVLLEPGQFTNLASLESINFPDNILGILSTRGSMAELGLDCLLSDTVIEPGSSGKLRFSTKNNSEHKITLKPGTPIVKCLFFKLG